MVAGVVVVVVMVVDKLIVEIRKVNGLRSFGNIAGVVADLGGS